VAKKVRGKRSGSIRDAVIQTMKKNPKWTAKQVGDAIGTNPAYVSTILAEARRAGLLPRPGKKVPEAASLNEKGVGRISDALVEDAIPPTPNSEGRVTFAAKLMATRDFVSTAGGLDEATALIDTLKELQLSN